MRYAAAAAQVRRPAPLVVRGLKPSAWADTWEGKADAPVDVGVRLVSEADLSRSRPEGARVATRLHPELDERSGLWVDAYNQAVMHYVLGHALCQPDDVTAPLFEMQDFVISHRLSTAGTLRLWDAVEELGIVDSPLSAEISEDGIDALAVAMKDDRWWARMSAGERRRAARLLQRVAEMGRDGPLSVTSAPHAFATMAIVSITHE